MGVKVANNDSSIIELGGSLRGSIYTCICEHMYISTYQLAEGGAG